MTIPKRARCLAPLLLPACMAWADWPAWRGGVEGSGIHKGPRPPIEWSTTRNIRWRTELPGRGNSTPVVWGGRVFMTQAIEKSGERLLLCFDRADGRILWQRGTTFPEKERSHPTNPPCSPSPVTDGEVVVASFGSAGVFCHDLSGRELWRRDLGKLDHVWGNGPSPVLHGELCIVYHGPGSTNALHALDRKTGRTLWRFDEPNWDTSRRNDGFRGKKDAIHGSFSTPIIVRSGSRDELIMSFPNEVRAFDPQRGTELWRCEGLSPLVYTSPIASEDIVVAMGGFDGNTVAVRTGGSGDVTATHRLWRLERSTGSIGTGVIRDGLVYSHTPKNLVSCIELKTGNVLWEVRPEDPGARGASWSSMTLVDDLILMPNQAGNVLVFRAGRTFEPVALNSVKETTNSSLAISGGEIFLRTHKALWCIREGAMLTGEARSTQ